MTLLSLPGCWQQAEDAVRAASCAKAATPVKQQNLLGTWGVMLYLRMVRVRLLSRWIWIYSRHGLKSPVLMIGTTLLRTLRANGSLLKKTRPLRNLRLNRSRKERPKDQGPRTSLRRKLRGPSLTQPTMSLEKSSSTSFLHEPCSIWCARRANPQQPLRLDEDYGPILTTKEKQSRQGMDLMPSYLPHTSSSHIRSVQVDGKLRATRTACLLQPWRAETQAVSVKDATDAALTLAAALIK